MNALRGIHHVTAITSSAEENYAFFTNILGMRLVKKPSAGRHPDLSPILRR